MGQAQSEVAPSDTADQMEPHPSSSPSMESLLAEAVAYGNDENESLEAKAQKALECPCIADLRNGPCGVQFSESFLSHLQNYEFHQAETDASPSRHLKYTAQGLEAMLCSLFQPKLSKSGSSKHNRLISRIKDIVTDNFRLTLMAA
ncbi:hypothetical protein SADUNF_Sadunf10G0194500 [Salix dunnii]|uniref:Uncharacterized protein n=1 Tax=Salix dunnii TaxID=1413687 RepID=A0A835MZA6_9ROSI|nr:hypothetical protein SADUNF_Sadunf10G0194500 [Salix dunnii]